MEQSPTIRSRAPRRLQIISWVVFGLATAALVLVGVGMLLVLPRFAHLWVEQQIHLPPVTAWLVQMPSWLVAVVILCWWTGLLVKERMAWSRRLTLLLNGLSLVAATGLLYGLRAALFLPLIELLEGLAK